MSSRFQSSHSQVDTSASPLRGAVRDRELRERVLRQERERREPELDEHVVPRLDDRRGGHPDLSATVSGTRRSR